MIPAKRHGLAILIFLLACTSLRAQGWEAGAAAGVVNDVEKHLELSGFKRSDVNLFLGLETSPNIFVRATFGSLRVAGSNAGKPLLTTGALPDLPDRINYITVGAAYAFKESAFTSSLFAGIGGYRVEPDAADPSVSSFRDRSESAWGIHAGADGSINIAPHVWVLLRLTYHNIRSATGRSLLTADGGLAYKF